MGEPSIRDEVIKLIEEEKRGSYIIYRRARRDDNGAPRFSPTRENNRSREANYDIPTNVSETMGYLFDDIPMRGLLNLSSSNHSTGRVIMAGDTRDDNHRLYLPYNMFSRLTGSLTAMPDEHDQIIIPRSDIEGKVISPLRIELLFNITTAETFRLDNIGRVEFFALSLMSKNERSHRL